MKAQPVEWLLGLYEAAGYAGVSKRTLKKAIALRQIPHYRHGPRRLVARPELDRWLERFRPPTKLDDAHGAVAAAERAATLMREDDRT